MLNDRQHGFWRRRSCVTQLLQVMEYFTILIGVGNSIDVVYLDFLGAFNSAPHEWLFTKIKSYWISLGIYNWIKSFLLITEGSNCKWRNVTFKNVIGGVPQGTVLGPLLFILFINVLSDTICSSCKWFTDDTKIYGSSRNQQTLQRDILFLFQWSSHGNWTISLQVYW